MKKPINNIGTEPKKAHEYQVSGHYGQTNKIIIEGDTLLDMEYGLSEQLEGIRELLNEPYSADSPRTIREVLES